jgi:hypothetical protein
MKRVGLFPSVLDWVTLENNQKEEESGVNNHIGDKPLCDFAESLVREYPVEQDQHYLSPRV